MEYEHINRIFSYLTVKRWGEKKKKKKAAYIFVTGSII